MIRALRIMTERAGEEMRGKIGHCQRFPRAWRSDDDRIVGRCGEASAPSGGHGSSNVDYGGKMLLIRRA